MKLSMTDNPDAQTKNTDERLVFRTVNPLASAGESLSILGGLILLGAGVTLFLALKDIGVFEVFERPLAGNVMWSASFDFVSWFIVFWPVIYVFPKTENLPRPPKVRRVWWIAANVLPVVLACGVAYLLRDVTPVFGVLESYLLLMLGATVGRAIGEWAWLNVRQRDLAPWRRVWSALYVPVSLLLIGFVTWRNSVAGDDVEHISLPTLVLYASLVVVGLALNAVRTWRTG